MKWEEIGTVKSSSSSTRYSIDVNEEGDLRCRCASYIHSAETPKACKHTRSDEAGELLRAYWRKKLPSRRTVGVVAGPFRPGLGGGRAAIGYIACTEPVIVVNHREFLQAQRIIAEAWNVVRRDQPYRFSNLQEALEELGRS
jgi:hypothetical protein